MVMRIIIIWLALNVLFVLSMIPDDLKDEPKFVDDYWELDMGGPWDEHFLSRP